MTVDRMKLSLQTVKDNLAIMEMCEEPDDAGYYLQLEHEKFVAKTIEKQIPKKIVSDEYDWACCPNCNDTFKMFDSFKKRNKFCGNCGQALDWSDV